MKLLKRLTSFLTPLTTPSITEEHSHLDHETNLNLAIMLIDQDKIADAISLLEARLKETPDDGRAYFFLGNARLANGQPELAVDAYLNALSIKPNSAGAQFNLGNAYGAMDKLDQQLEAYNAATALNEEFFDAEFALGDLHEKQQQTADALRRFQRAIEINPDSHMAQARYALLMIAQGRDETSENACMEAIEKLEKHLSVHPTDFDAWLLLGNIHLELDPLSLNAENAYARVLKDRPRQVEALNNLGSIHKARGDLQRAYSYYKTALTHQPHSSEILNNLGVLLMNIGRFDEAIEYLKQGIKEEPKFAAGFCNLGLAQDRCGLYDDALFSFSHALDLEPNFHTAANNLGACLLRIGRIDEARQALERAISLAPEIDDTYSNLAGVYLDCGDYKRAATLYRKALDLNPNATVAFSNLLFCHNYTRELSKSELLDEALAYGRVVSQLATPFQSWNISRKTTRKLRIGLVSADFYMHPVGFFLQSIVQALKAKHDERLEIIAFYNNWNCDDVTHAIQTGCSEWHLIFHQTDKQAAQAIHDAKIDILIDLSGHTGRNRLPVFAWRPAPVQITWLGYFATTGLAEIDYLIADPFALPASEEAYFAEKVWRLPETRLCFSPPSIDIEVNETPALKNGYITFGCFNALPKITDEVVALWARIMNALPDSKLMLKARQLGEASVQKIMWERFAQHGIDAKRVILLPPSDRKSYLESYNGIDIALDPFPYTGGTTTVEALWMGVPVLTLAGEGLLSRQGVSMLSNTQLNDWIAKDENEYFDKAISHAKQTQSLNYLRRHLRNTFLASPICDAGRFAGHFAEALQEIWDTECSRH